MEASRGCRVAVVGMLFIVGAACNSGAPDAGGREPRAIAPNPQPSADHATTARQSAPEVSTWCSSATDERAAARPGRVNRWVTRRPQWLGKRVLPKRPDGIGVVRPTPPILRNRRLATIDLLPPPTGNRFVAHIGPVPRWVAHRSTWRPKCPVSLDELAYVTMSFWGFDHKAHTGQLIVNSTVAEDIVGVFESLFDARFPIEEMRVIDRSELHAPPTGDTNVTSSFECRPVALGSTWSQHSYGLAVDINPFQNPYVRGDAVLPERASAYLDRDWRRPGMIAQGDVVTTAFASIGWGWGGRWNSLKDWMHFSQNGH